MAFFSWASNLVTHKNTDHPFGWSVFLVGATGFEPTTFWSRTKRATKLRYAPKEKGLRPTLDPFRGAKCQTRTDDLRITNALLYRLS